MTQIAWKLKKTANTQDDPFSDPPGHHFVPPSSQVFRRCWGCRIFMQLFLVGEAKLSSHLEINEMHVCISYQNEPLQGICGSQNTSPESQVLQKISNMSSCKNHIGYEKLSHFKLQITKTSISLKKWIRDNECLTYITFNWIAPNLTGQFLSLVSHLQPVCFHFGRWISSSRVNTSSRARENHAVSKFKQKNIHNYNINNYQQHASPKNINK